MPDQHGSASRRRPHTSSIQRGAARAPSARIVNRDRRPVQLDDRRVTDTAIPRWAKWPPVHGDNRIAVRLGRLPQGNRPMRAVCSGQSECSGFGPAIRPESVVRPPDPRRPQHDRRRPEQHSDTVRSARPAGHHSAPDRNSVAHPATRRHSCPDITLILPAITNKLSSLALRSSASLSTLVSPFSTQSNNRLTDSFR
jgi:hypothetical protein